MYLLFYQSEFPLVPGYICFGSGFYKANSIFHAGIFLMQLFLDLIKVFFSNELILRNCRCYRMLDRNCTKTDDDVGLVLMTTIRGFNFLG